MILGIEIQFRILCSHCNSYNQVLGLKTKLTCYNCSRPVDIRQKLADSRVSGIKYHFGGYYDIIREAMAILKEGEEGKDSSSQSVGAKFFYRRSLPYCPACSHPVDAKKIFSGDSDHITCADCGKHIPVRKRDSGVKQWDKRIDFVLNDSGESAERFARIDNEPGQDGLVVHCKGCGRGLEVDARNRILTCPQCSLVNIIPDAVWLRISPVPEDEPFFLLIEYTREDLFDAWIYFLHPTQYFLDQNTEIHKNIRHDVRKFIREMDVNDLRSKVSQKGDYVFKELVIRTGLVLDKVIDLFITHEDARVRQMVFEMDALPPSIIGWMAEKGPIEARMSLTDRRDLPEEVLNALSRDPDPRVRCLIALHPDLTKNIMKRLKKDPDRSVRAKLKENENYHRHFWW
jgi:hypothetical protein